MAADRVPPYRANPDIDEVLDQAEYYHVFADCIWGSKIEPEHRLQGSGGLDMCHDCEARMSGMES